MRKLGKFWLTFLAVAALLLVLAVACEEEEKEETPTGTPTAAATGTPADTPTALSAAARVKPIPRPPTSICAFSIGLRRVQANSASASSEWCLRLFIRSPGTAEIRMAKSSLR